VHMNISMCLKEDFDLRGFVSREVVGDHVDLRAARLVHDDVGEEGDKLGRGVTRRASSARPAWIVARELSSMRSALERLMCC
jgi:hypothetical protein